MSCAQWEERIALGVSGDLVEDAATVEQHLASCEGCRTFAAEMATALGTLQAAHQEIPSQAHFATVRTRVMARIESDRRSAWRWLWAPAAAAAAIAVLIVGMNKLSRPVPALPQVAFQRPAAPAGGYAIPVIATPRPATRPKHAATAVASPRPRPNRHETAEPLLIRIVTNNPDVVLYWIADRKGD